jgi:hypothetical protein
MVGFIQCEDWEHGSFLPWNSDWNDSLQVWRLPCSGLELVISSPASPTCRLQFRGFFSLFNHVNNFPFCIYTPLFLFLGELYLYFITIWPKYEQQTVQLNGQRSEVIMVIILCANVYPKAGKTEYGITHYTLATTWNLA